MAINEDDLFQPEEVEALIKDGRVPVGFGTIQEGSGPAKTAFWLPPKGVKRGDSINGNAMMGYSFFSPEGEPRGPSEMYVVSLEIGRKIQEEVTRVMKKMEE